MGASQPNSDGVFGRQHVGTDNNEFNALSFTIDQMLSRVNTATLVKINSITGGGEGSPVGRVDVTPLVNQIDGIGQPVPHGVIYNLPYVRAMSSGGTNAFICDPKVGDVGVAVFCDSDISKVKASGAAAPPGSKRKFDMADGIYLGSVDRASSPERYVLIDDTGITVKSDGLLVEEAEVIQRTATSIIESAQTHQITVPEFTIIGNLHVTGLVHCTWEGELIDVAFGGTGADMSETGGTDHVVVQLTKGGPFTSIPLAEVGTVLIYENGTPMPEDVGGYPAGTTFEAQTMQEMFDGLLYPYQFPQFAYFYIVDQDEDLEVGDTSNADPVFVWANSNHGNIVENSIDIVDLTGSESLVDSYPNSGVVTVEHPGIYRIVPTIETYRIYGENTKSQLFTKDFSIQWKWKLYYGESSDSPLDSASINALRVGELATSFEGDYVFNYAPSEYKYLCFPSSFGSVASFTDLATGLNVPFEDAYTVTVTNTHGLPTSYKVYRSSYKIGGALTVRVA